MKIEYDTAHDLLNIEFLANVAIDDSVETDGVVIDYAKDKRIVAIEVLDASKRTTRKPLDLTDLAIVTSSGKAGRSIAKKNRTRRNVAAHDRSEADGLNGLNCLNVWNGYSPDIYDLGCQKYFRA